MCYCPPSALERHSWTRMLDLVSSALSGPDWEARLTELEKVWPELADRFQRVRALRRQELALS